MPSAKPKQKVKRKKSDESASSPKRPSHNRKAIGHIKQLLDGVPPARLKKELLYVFLIFLEHEHDTLPVNFRQMVTDYYMLFHFLDKVEAEMNGVPEFDS